jgi:hypothetical protein
MVVHLDSTIGTVCHQILKNMETNNNSDKKGTFGHFMLLFVGFIVVLVAISYLVTSLLK